jgi:hypothetical protein
MKKLYLLLLFSLVLTLNSSAQNKAKSGGPRTGMAEPGKLVGTWKIIEYADFDTLTGKWKDRYGLHPRGYFIYTKSGIVSINISTDSPVKVSEDSAKSINVNYYQNYYSNAFSYFGTYIVDSKKSTVTHYVKGGSLLWYIDTDQPRQFMLKSDTLTIGDNKTTRRVLVRAD